MKRGDKEGGRRQEYRHRIPEGRRASDRRVGEEHRDAVEQTIERLARAPGRPRGMTPFDGLFRDGWREEELGKDNRPVVGTLCNFVPDELVLAAGAIPIRLDFGLAAAAEAGQRLVTADVCPEVRALVGGHLGRLPYFELADLLVVPTACDGKKKLARTLGEQREVWVLELPQTRDSRRSRELWLGEIRDLAHRLERLTGRRIRRRALAQAIQLLNRRTSLLRRLNELRWADPRRLSGRDAFLVMHASFVADPAWWVERTEELLDELEQRGGAGDAERSGEAEKPTPVLVTGSPILFPDYQLLHLVEESGAVVVADEMCSGTQRLHNPTVVDEGTVSGMLRAAAEKTLLPCTCPCFVSSDLRIDRVLELAAQSGARGVIHHTLRLCQLFDMELPRVEAALRERDLPLLALHAEYGSEGAAALKNRVDAFLEMLQQ